MKHLHTFESFLNEGLFKPANIKAYYEALCKSEGITPLPVRFDSVGMGGAALTFNPKTMKSLYISFDVTKLKDPEYAVIHELTHQIKLETEQNAYLGKNDQSAKFKKLENRLIEKYMYSKFSGILHLHTFESFLNESSDIEYSIKNIEDNNYIVRAMYNGKSVGELYFIKSRSKSVLKAGSLSVDPNHRRKGIASSMYEFAEKELGMKFVRSEDVLTPDGKLLWNNPNRKFGLMERGNKPAKYDVKLFEEFGDDYPKQKFVELSHRDAMNYANEIFDLIQYAYARKGGNIEIQKPSDLKGSDITYWILKDIDQNPDADIVVGGKFTKSGVKITLIGQDGSSEAKKEVMGKVTDLMQTGGFYAEVDKELAQKLGLKYIQDESLIRKVIDKDLTYNQDGSYDRKIGPRGNQVHTKVLVGKPRK